MPPRTSERLPSPATSVLSTEIWVGASINKKSRLATLCTNISELLIIFTSKLKIRLLFYFCVVGSNPKQAQTSGRTA
jgi:hypothetical protein